MREAAEFRRALEALGRAITPESLARTRELAAARQPDVALPGRLLRDLRYGEHERQRLDLFLHEGGGSRPLLIFVHGGGFVAGDKHSPGTPFYDNIGAWALRQGWHAINMTYRLAPDHGWPSGVEDIRRVVDWLHAEAAVHGLDPERLFLMGQSAGACHAAGYVAHGEVYGGAAHGLRGLILLSGLYDFSRLPLSQFERAYLGTDDSLMVERSPLSGLLEAAPPLLVSLAEFDPAPFDAQGLLLLEAWRERHGSLPHFVWLHGQNHLSPVLCLGLSGDLLGPQLRLFIDSL